MTNFNFQAALSYEGYTRHDEEAMEWHYNLKSSFTFWKSRAQTVMLKNRAHHVSNAREFDDASGHFKELHTDQVLE